MRLEVIRKNRTQTSSILFLLLLVAHVLPAAERITAVQKCELGPCVMMEINYPEKLVPNAKDLGNGHAEFSIPIFGRFGDEPITSYLLSFNAYTDGLSCDNFGQAFVAVQGLKNGHPLLKTSRGNLEVVDSHLEVGCPDCIQQVDKKTDRQVSAVRTPSTDLRLMHVENIYVDDRAGIWLKMVGGGCDGLVRQGDYDTERESYSCLRDGLHKLMNPKSINKNGLPFDRYDIKSLPYFIDVRSDSCS